MTTRRVVVDVGSNSIRLFLCSGIGSQGPEGERRTTVTGLKRGAAPDGTVTGDALERLEACLQDYRLAIDAFDPRAELVVVGTSAVRDAPNRDQIGALVQDVLEVDLRELSGPQEAELSYIGARLAVAGEGPILVVDIGGGSTELVRGDASGPSAAVSIDVGSVRFTEQFLHDDPPTREQMIDLRRSVADLVVPALAAVGGPAPIVGVAGTMTSIAAIAHGEYDPRAVHGMVLASEEVDDITERLAGLPLAERVEVPGLHPDRAPAIVAGALIASTVLGAAFASEIAVSERDLLDGVILELSRGAGND